MRNDGRIRYIDAPVLRDRDVEAGGDLGKSGSGLDQRLYYTTDANKFRGGVPQAAPAPAGPSARARRPRPAEEG